eukprot:5327818-Prymnesium_polylepis.1
MRHERAADWGLLIAGACGRCGGWRGVDAWAGEVEMQLDMTAARQTQPGTSPMGAGRPRQELDRRFSLDTSRRSDQPSDHRREAPR